MAKSGATITKDDVGKVKAALGRLSDQVVLVGVPADKAPRTIQRGDVGKPHPTQGRKVTMADVGTSSGEPINNAELGYIHEFGAPEAHIPPRPFLLPGVAGAGPQINPVLKAAGLKALDNDFEAVKQLLNRVGIVASVNVKKLITAGLSPGLAAGTRRKRDGSLDAAGLAARKPLIDTGALLNSITYVVTTIKEFGQ